MAYREYHNGDAWITADENNERNAARGTMVRSGGTITIAASSSEPLLSIAETDIRVAGADHSLAAGTVALPANATAYPRRDLVIARKPPDATSGPSFDVLPGDAISPDLLQRLQNTNQPDGARIDDEGLPIHPPESIPQVQPPAARGLRDEATVLGMVYVPPGTSDSTDLSDEYITDLRREGIGVEGVLRTGDAVAEVESHPDALAADISGTANNADLLGGSASDNYQETRPIFAMRLSRDTGVDNQINFDCPEVESRDNFAAYHAEAAGIGNFAGNSGMFFISGDWVVQNVGGDISWGTNTTTAIGPISDVNLRVTGTPKLQISFNSSQPFNNEGNIRGQARVLRSA